MEISYKKDGINNFLIIKECAEFENDYKMEMLVNNRIDGIVPLKIKNINNEQQIYYDITSKNSMNTNFLKQKMRAKDIERFVIGLSNVAKITREYLLDFNNIILDMDYIFIEDKTEVYNFCYYPGNNKEINDGLKEIFTKILERLDHKDNESVIIGYGLQQMILKENVSIPQMIDYINENRMHKNKKEEYGIEKNIVYEDKQTDNEIPEKMENKYHMEQENKDKINKKKRWWQFWKREKPLSEVELLNELEKNEVINEWENDKSYEDIDIDSSYNYEDNRINKKVYEDKFIEEEATILLTTNIQAAGIVLRSTDIENPISIIPNGFPCIIGKSKKSSDCNVDEQFISRVHARLYEEVDGYYIEDLNSSNGTFLNGEKLKAHVQEMINIGDTIMLANMEFIVE